MAIAFAHVSIHTRAKGHSALAASSYRAGIKLMDSRTGITYDFSNRHDVVFRDLLLPDGADGMFLDRETLWNAAEAAEKRKDAQLCKDVVLALPKELDRVQQIELARRFAHMHFVSNGLPADIAIHDHGDGNPHAHILIPTRRLEGRQFSKYKARDLNPAFAKGVVVEKDYWGEQWREMQNEFFIEHHLDLQVDLNHVISERHRGKHRNENAHYLLEENRLIQQARIEVTRDNIENFINHLSLQHSVFTRRDVEKLLFKTFQASDNPSEYLQFIEKVLGHKDLVLLGDNERGQVCYTTRNHFLQEAQLLNDIENMMLSTGHVFNKPIEGLARQYRLSEEQTEAFKHITQSPDISVVIGRPGTGKSYLLKPVKEYYEQSGQHVIGAALSGKVAKALQAETGINSFTLASLSYRLGNERIKLTDKHVIIIDEAGMVDFANMAYLIKEAKKAGAKVVLIGDPDQLKPIQKGEIFRGIAARTGYIELENIKRQQEAGDRKASLNLAKGNIDEAIAHYQNKNAIIMSETSGHATKNLIADWQKDLKTTDLTDTIMLSFSRKAVNNLNDHARAALIKNGNIGHENISYPGMERMLQISSGERLLFRENNKTLGVRNGDTATVKQVSKHQLTVQLDSGETLSIPQEYQALDYAYALTVHKSQGMTAKKVKVLIDNKYWDRHLSFVAMTRHKESLRLYADRKNHPTEQALKQTLSRSSTKDNVIDWPLDFATRAGFDSDSLIGKAVNHIAGVGHTIKQGYNYVVNYETYLLKVQQKGRMHNIRHARACAKQKAGRMDIKQSKIFSRELYSEQYPTSANEYESLKKECPSIRELDSLINNRNRTSGYYTEKTDKKINELCKKLALDKQLMNCIKIQNTHIYETIKKINAHQQKHSKYHER